MMAWDDTEVVSQCLSRVPGWGPVTLSHLITDHLQEPATLLKKKEVAL